MILSYRDKRTSAFADGRFVREFQGFSRQAYQRLEVLDAAASLDELRALRGNRLEALKGERAVLAQSANRARHPARGAAGRSGDQAIADMAGRACAGAEGGVGQPELAQRYADLVDPGFRFASSGPRLLPILKGAREPRKGR